MARIGLTESQEELLRWLVEMTPRIGDQESFFALLDGDRRAWIAIAPDSRERKFIRISDLEQLKAKGAISYVERGPPANPSRPVYERIAATFEGYEHINAEKVRAATPPSDIQRNLATVLGALTKLNQYETLTGPDLMEATGLDPQDINDAVALLEEEGYAEVLRTLGTHPFTFHEVSSTPRGRFEYQRANKAASGETETAPSLAASPTPAGSPYGFKDEDWEIVLEAKSQSGTLSVVLGYQFDSTNYTANSLQVNVKKMFETAIDEYNELPGSLPLTLSFRALAAGYGEHLFNQIARDIISADIAVFDSSDLNPNVMIELGVALTWGVRVLPIRHKNAKRPPSDISGQTWATYVNSGKRFEDHEHARKLLTMVLHAARKKGRKGL